MSVPRITNHDMPTKVNDCEIWCFQFSDLCQFLNGLDIRQLMTQECLIFKCVFCWKLFGCLYNCIGICVPTNTWISALNTGMTYQVTTKPIILSKFHLHQIDNNKQHILTLSSLDVKWNSAGYSFEDVYDAMTNFAILTYFTQEMSIMPTSLLEIIMSFSHLQAKLKCNINIDKKRRLGFVEK